MQSLTELICQSSVVQLDHIAIGKLWSCCALGPQDCISGCILHHPIKPRQGPRPCLTQSDAYTVEGCAGRFVPLQFMFIFARLLCMGPV